MVGKELKELLLCNSLFQLLLEGTTQSNGEKQPSCLHLCCATVRNQQLQPRDIAVTLDLLFILHIYCVNFT